MHHSTELNVIMAISNKYNIMDVFKKVSIERIYTGPYFRFRIDVALFKN